MIPRIILFLKFGLLRRFHMKLQHIVVINLLVRLKPTLNGFVRTS